MTSRCRLHTANIQALCDFADSVHKLCGPLDILANVDIATVRGSHLTQLVYGAKVCLRSR